MSAGTSRRILPGLLWGSPGSSTRTARPARATRAGGCSRARTCPRCGVRCEKGGGARGRKLLFVELMERRKLGIRACPVVGSGSEVSTRKGGREVKVKLTMDRNAIQGRKTDAVSKIHRELGSKVTISGDTITVEEGFDERKVV